MKNVLPESLLRKWILVRDEGLTREIHQVGYHKFTVSPKKSDKEPEKSDRVVDLEKKTCTCGEFQEHGFPCRHAAGAIMKAKAFFMNYIEVQYHNQSLKAIYSSFFNPIDIASVEADGSTILEAVLKKRGRPKKRRIRSRGELTASDRNHCGSCGKTGHYASTCQERHNSQPKKVRKQQTCSSCREPGHNKASCMKTTAEERSQT